jgi:hypothetical protein
MNSFRKLLRKGLPRRERAETHGVARIAAEHGIILTASLNTELFRAAWLLTNPSSARWGLSARASELHHLM